MTIDLRSDTVTKPSAEMKEAMMNAPVGDDVFSEDPTINALEEYASEIFGMEAGIFCSSGTQTNQIAIKVHTRPGDEVICSKDAHIYKYEGGGIMVNSGCSVRYMEGNRGMIDLKFVQENINNPFDVHLPITSLVAIENTSNRGGGAIYSYDETKAMSDFCRTNKFGFHLDGARLFNALVEQNIPLKEYGSRFDSISICLSKGLGAPVGSVLIGKKDFISKARRVRKVFGGGMRQAGIIAAAGLYSLKHNVERLRDDHYKAKLIESTLVTLPWVTEIMPVETNIVIFKINSAIPSQTFMDYFASKNILFFSLSPGAFRFVTHLDFTNEMLEVLLAELKKYKH
jgi:threonine aldolase